MKYVIVIIIVAILIFICFIGVFLYFILSDNSQKLASPNYIKSQDLMNNPMTNNTNENKIKKEKKNQDKNDIKSIMKKKDDCPDCYDKIKLKDENIIDISLISSSSESIFDIDSSSSDSLDDYDFQGNKNFYNITSITKFSDFLINTIKDGKIFIKNKEDNIITINSDIKSKMIISFNGYLYSLSFDDYLYFLNNDYIDKTDWKWDKVIIENPKNNNISYISSTLDNKYLWIQNYDKGYLLDKNLKKKYETHISRGVIRKYGKDKDNYVEINTDKDIAIVYPNGKKKRNVLNCVIDYYNNLRCITQDNKHKYDDICIIDGNATYIKK